jgi:hypothetical protein
MEATATSISQNRHRTPEETKELEQRLLNVLERHPQASKRELSRRLDVPHSTIWYMRARLNVSRNRVQSDQVLFISIAQQIRDLVIQEGVNLTDEQLAVRIGVSLCTLQRWLKKLNIPTGKQRRFGIDERLFRKMWEEGWSDCAIARVMGCHHQRVQKWRTRNGLIANIIHDSVRNDFDCKGHTPATLLDIIGSPTGRKKSDLVWAFAALGATRRWLKARFPEVSMSEIDSISDGLLEWKVPRHLKTIIRRRQLKRER